MVKQKKALMMEKKDWTKNVIQSTAKKLFFKKGYTNCTMDEISELAGVSKGLIYTYFKNKDDLYLSLMLPVLKEINRSAEEFKKDVMARKYKNGREIIMAFCKRYQDLYNYNLEGIKIIQVFQQGDLISGMSKENQKELDKLARENFIFARGIIELCIDLKLLPKIDSTRLMDLLWGTFIGMIQLEESKYRATKKNHIMEMLEFSFKTICDGIFLEKI